MHTRACFWYFYFIIAFVFHLMYHLRLMGNLLLIKVESMEKRWSRWKNMGKRCNKKIKIKEFSTGVRQKMFLSRSPAFPSPRIKIQIAGLFTWPFREQLRGITRGQQSPNHFAKSLRSLWTGRGFSGNFKASSRARPIVKLELL